MKNDYAAPDEWSGQTEGQRDRHNRSYRNVEKDKRIRPYCFSLVNPMQ